METILLADRWAKSATITASSTLAGSSVDHLVDNRLLTSWGANAAGAQTLTIDSGAAVAADALALLHTNLLTAAATVKVETSPDNSNWTEVVAASAATLDAGTLITWAASTVRYRRVTITTASVKAVIGALCLGSSLTLPRPLRPEMRKIELRQAIGRDSSGETYIYNRQPFDGLTHPLTFRRMTAAQKDALEILQRRDAVGCRSFFAWTDFNGVCHPVRFVDSRLDIVGDGLDRFRVDLQLLEESPIL